MHVTIIIAASCFAIGKKKKIFPGPKDLDGYVEVSVTCPYSVIHSYQMNSS